MNMERSTINKIITSRHLYTLAKDHLSSEKGIKISVGVNLLQDSVELFLLAVSEFVDANIGPNTKFYEYFDIINNKLEGKELPFKGRLLSLNKLRVNSKHHGIQPASEETKDLLTVVNEFYEEVSVFVFKKKFAAFSLIDLLTDGESKELLKSAEDSFEKRDYSKTLIDCRKAIYVEIEQYYNIYHYKDVDPAKQKTALGLFSMQGYKAPYWAKNKNYIDEHVAEPTDYIVYDHNLLEMELLKSGASSNTFWNIHNLTPKVFRTKNEQWVLKDEFECFEKEGLQERAEYVLSATVELILSLHQSRKQYKSTGYRSYYIDLIEPKVPVYSKASLKSQIVRLTPDGVIRLDTDFRVTGLDSEDTFWHVSYYNSDDHIYFSGYVHGSFVKE
jgi:hypothetical protein